MYLLVLLLPFLSFVTVSLFGFLIGRIGTGFITVFSVLSSFFISCYIFFEVCLCGSSVQLELYKWINIGDLNFSWGLLFDPLTACMLIVVTSISSIVHIYSLSYMGYDPHLGRFLSYLSLFTFCMLLLVTSDNFLQLFWGWEGVGIASYLLINFWFTRIQANKSAMKALIVNKVGDFSLIVALVFIFYVFKSNKFDVVFSLIPTVSSTYLYIFNYPVNTVTLIGILLFIGAVGKSAQLGLHTWLPDAMEGPTPVSALIHAATMVTAGVFLIIRCSPLFEYSSYALVLISFLGAFTAFFGATCGLVQNDFKRVVAYSTCSQLGYMVFVCGLSGYSVGLFHLMNHAFFKALLFLGAGSVIHALSDEQDIRTMGGIFKLVPLTYSFILVASLSLMGFPFLTGFYSKDFILEVAFSSFYIDSLFIYWLGTISACLTSFYSIRLIYYGFLVNFSRKSKNVTYTSPKQVSTIHESDYILLMPLFILGIGSVLIGFLSKDMIIGMGTPFFNQSIFNSPYTYNCLLDPEFLPFYIKIIPVLFSLTGTFSSFFLYNNINFFSFILSPFSILNFKSKPTETKTSHGLFYYLIRFIFKFFYYIYSITIGRFFHFFIIKPISTILYPFIQNSKLFKFILSFKKKKQSTKRYFLINAFVYSFYTFLTKKWFFDQIFNYFIIKNTLFFGYRVTLSLIDKGLIEFLGPYGFIKNVRSFGNFFKSLQSGFTYNYSLIFILQLGIFTICAFFFKDFRYFIVDSQSFYIEVILFSLILFIYQVHQYIAFSFSTTSDLTQNQFKTKLKYNYYSFQL